MVVEMPRVRLCISQDKIAAPTNLSGVQAKARSIHDNDCRPMSHTQATPTPERLKMAKKRKKPTTTTHLWTVEVRHRDYLATRDAARGKLYMKHSTLNIECDQPPAERPSIDKAIARARAWLYRHQRDFGLPGIQKVDYLGTLDK